MKDRVPFSFFKCLMAYRTPQSNQTCCGTCANYIDGRCRDRHVVPESACKIPEGMVCNAFTVKGRNHE